MISRSGYPNLRIPKRFGMNPDDYRFVYETQSLVYEPIQAGNKEFYKSTTAHISINKVLTNDQIFGLFSDFKVSNFTTVIKANEYLDPRGVKESHILRAISLHLTDKQVHHERRAFTFIDMISKIGGFGKGLVVIGHVLLYPFYYKL